jgi:hypothetical protein
MNAGHLPIEIGQPASILLCSLPAAGKEGL